MIQVWLDYDKEGWQTGKISKFQPLWEVYGVGLYCRLCYGEHMVTHGEPFNISERPRETQ